MQIEKSETRVFAELAVGIFCGGVVVGLIILLVGGAAVMAELRPDLDFSLDEIRFAIQNLSILHASGKLDTADMRGGHDLIMAELETLRLALLDLAPVPATRTIPILTLAEVAARSQHRDRPRLHVVGGGDAA